MKRYFALLLALITLTSLHAAKLELPTVFSDHMVLQRNTTVKVWGKGEPGLTVFARIADQKGSAEVADDGTWMLDLAPMEASKTPQTLTISSGSDTLTFEDVLIGDVWLCSGQSNMELALENSVQGDVESIAAEKPLIRLYQVNRVTVQEPRFSAPDGWKTCTGENASRFSAVGYYFGKDIQQVTDVPIGLIDSSWGGTPVVAWTRKSTLLSFPHTAERMKEWDYQLEHFDELHEQWKKDMKAFAEGNNIVITNIDEGISEEAAPYSEIAYDDSDWKFIKLPDVIEHHIGNVDGAFWYRLKVDLPEAFQNTDLSLQLGPIDDLDVTFVNGVEVGSHMRSEDKPYAIPRVYPIPSNLTADGSLVIAVRIFDEVGDGGFTGSPSAMLIVNTDGDEIPLAGKWRFKAEVELPPAVGSWNVDGPTEPQGASSPNRPGILADSMLSPVCPYALKGGIWYQGEADVGWAPDLYEDRLELMLDDWRERWSEPDLPLGVVQLANYMEPMDHPTDTGWARVRDSQLRLSKKDPNVGLAVIIDIGETDDIHPRNKETVGHRLARWALTDIYGVLELSGGPLFESYVVKGDTIELIFSDTNSGLKVMNGGSLAEFTIAGKDRVFYNAEATITGNNTIEVRAKEVPNPVAVRYAWADNPIHANLVNQHRLPASPFRTDDW